MDYLSLVTQKIVDFQQYALNSLENQIYEISKYGLHRPSDTEDYIGLQQQVFTSKNTRYLLT
jgi:hypothetical protein